jgi:hypothetical protein
MHLMDEKEIASNTNSEARLNTPVHPGCAVLRRAIRGNIVSFPSQIPVFLKQPPADVQWRVVQLFFVRGWSSAKIGERFNVPRHQIWEILNEWSVRALALGYVQVIDTESFAACCHVSAEYGKHDIEGAGANVAPVRGSAHRRFPDPAVAVAPAGLGASGGKPGDYSENTNLVRTLNAAIASCEEWQDDFWMRAAALLRDLRTVASVAGEIRRSSEQAERLVTTPPNAEEQVSHVA